MGLLLYWQIGCGSEIPPDADIVFEVEVIDIEPVGRTSTKLSVET